MIEWLVKKIHRIWDKAHRYAILERIMRMCDYNSSSHNFIIQIPGIKDGSCPISFEVLPGDLVKVENNDGTGYIIHLSKFTMTFIKKEEQK